MRDIVKVQNIILSIFQLQSSGRKRHRTEHSLVPQTELHARRTHLLAVQGLSVNFLLLRWLFASIFCRWNFMITVASRFTAADVEYEQNISRVPRPLSVDMVKLSRNNDFMKRCCCCSSTLACCYFLSLTFVSSVVASSVKLSCAHWSTIWTHKTAS